MEPDIRLTIQRAARALESKKIENPSQLAAAANISRSMATAAWNYNPKNGSRLPDLRTLWKIARALNCNVGDLVQFVGTRRPKSAEANGKKR
jgi:DNA-binding Xre family transcriptional regulator